MSILGSLRFRLMLAATIWVMVVLAAGFVAFSYICRTQVETQAVEELEDHVAELERIARFSKDSENILPFSDPRYEAAMSGFYWQVGEAGAVRHASASLAGREIGALPQDANKSGAAEQREVDGPSGPMLAITKFAPASEGSTRFAVGMDKRHIEAAVREFDGIIAAALGSLGAVLLASVLAFITWGMAPFGKLAHAMREVRAGATQSVEGRHPTEVQPLVNELNSMIKGQRDSLQRARAQAGNLAHALKTPLAIVTDEAFLLGQRGESAAAHTIADQCKAMQVHIDHHIARARAQAVSRMPGLRSSVSQNIAGIVSALGRLHVQSGIEIEQNVDASLHAAMDEQDLSELVANLIDNAYKFARSRIAVTATALGSESLLISIEDDGPGLPPEARDRVFAPGVRLDETRPGTGLGLSIVRDLIELYEGKIELSASSLGGLAARVALPRQA